MIDAEGNKDAKFSKGDVPKCTPPYPQILLKKEEDNLFKKFVDLSNK